MYKSRINSAIYIDDIMVFIYVSNFNRRITC